MSYKDYAVALHPPWLQGANGQKWLKGFYNHLDNDLANLKSGVKARFPDHAASAGDDTALGRIGSDRAMPRYPGETDGQYGLRLRQAWGRYTQGGTSAAISAELQGLGYTGISYITNAGWSPSPPDGVTTWWSRFWVVIQGHSYSAVTYGSGLLYGSGTLYGGTFTSAQIDAIRNAILAWKPAHAYCEDVIIAYGTNILPAGKTVSGFTVGTNAAYIPVRA